MCVVLCGNVFFPTVFSIQIFGSNLHCLHSCAASGDRRHINRNSLNTDRLIGCRDGGCRGPECWEYYYRTHWLIFILKWRHLVWFDKVYNCMYNLLVSFTIQDLFYCLDFSSSHSFCIVFFFARILIHVLNCCLWTILLFIIIFRHIDNEDTTKTCLSHGLVLIHIASMLFSHCFFFFTCLILYFVCFVISAFIVRTNIFTKFLFFFLSKRITHWSKKRKTKDEMKMTNEKSVKIG